MNALYFSCAITCILICCLKSGNGQLPVTESSLTSPSECYGAGLSVNATCPASQSIALGTIRVGVQPSSQNCNATQTAGDGSGCCDATSGCEFNFPLTDNTLYHDQCNGRSNCMPGIQVVNVIHGQCNTSVYPQYTQYMYFNFYCIDNDRSTQMSGGSLLKENVPLYLQSPGYPNGISDSISDSSCSVEIDNCNAAINVYIIDRNLADYTNSTLCFEMQSISIVEQDGSALMNWTCSQNTYTISQPISSSDNYITVNFTNIMTSPGGRFWIGFEATMASNISIDCPAVARKYCLPTTSSTSSTTSTTATTTTSTATTTGATTTTTSVTSTSTPTSTTETTSITTTSVTTTSATTTPTTSATTTELSTTPTLTTTTTSNLTTITGVNVAASTSSSSNMTTVIIVVCSCLAAVLVVVIIIGVIIWRKNRKKKSPEESTCNLIDEQDTESIKSRNNESHTPSSSESNCVVVNEHREEIPNQSEPNDVVKKDDDESKSIEEQEKSHEECTVNPNDVQDTQSNKSQENGSHISLSDDSNFINQNEHRQENEIQKKTETIVNKDVNECRNSNDTDERNTVPIISGNLREKNEEKQLSEYEDAIDNEDSLADNGKGNVTKVGESSDIASNSIDDSLKIQPSVQQTTEPLPSRDEKYQHEETTEFDDASVQESTENALTGNIIPPDEKTHDNSKENEHNELQSKIINVKNKETEREILLDRVDIEFASTSSACSGEATPSLSERQITPIKETEEPIHRQPGDNNKVIKPDVEFIEKKPEKTPSTQKVSVPVKKSKRRPRQPVVNENETQYERYYRNVAKGFAGPEFLERRINKLIQERKDKRKRIKRRRRNNVVAPSDSPDEQSSG